MRISIPQSVFDSPDARRVQNVGHAESVRQLNATPRHLLDPGNPNHPDNFTNRIFGYLESDLLAMQYKPTKA